jgi:hypothetical protein
VRQDEGVNDAPRPPVWVLTYEPAEGFMSKVPVHYPAHAALASAAHERGELLLIGLLDDPPSGESMAVFASREAAERFVAEDPFVEHGVVGSWRLRPWAETLTG